MGVFRADGTRLTRAALGGLVTAVTDPRVRLTEPIYEDFNYAHEQASPVGRVGRRLLYSAGDVVRQSDLDALFAVPTVTAVTPAGGPVAGGTAVTITGTGFTPGTTVTVGGAAAANVRVVSATQITCVSPAGTLGARDVVVTTDHSAATRAGAFTYA